MYETEESIKRVQRLVLEAIAIGLNELAYEQISKQTKTKLIRLVEDLSDALGVSLDDLRGGTEDGTDS